MATTRCFQFCFFFLKINHGMGNTVHLLPTYMLDYCIQVDSYRRELKQKKARSGHINHSGKGNMATAIFCDL